MLKSWMTRAVLGRTSVSSALQPSSKPDAAFEATWRRSFKSRLLLMLGAVLCWAVVLEARLVYLQVVKHEDFKKEARAQQEDLIESYPIRGDIRDRNGELLAYSVESYRVIADPKVVTDPRLEVQEICAALIDCTSDERVQLEKKLSAKSRYALVRNSRALSPQAAMRLQELIRQRVKDKKPPVLTLFPESRRYYPKLTLAAHVVGAVGANGRGVSGLEHGLDKTIAGQSGRIRVQVDAGQQQISSVVEKEATAGASIELTLDLRLQYIAEKELAAAMHEYNAVGGSILIMEPRTGEILAQASYPTFNPNNSGAYSDADRVNPTVQSPNEPGSTMKLVTLSAALNEGVMTPQELIDTNPGFVKLAGRKPITEAHGKNYGVLSLEEVLIKSSNVGAIRIGDRVGSARLLDYAHRFGLGEKLAPDFGRGQSRGQLEDGPLDDSSRASISMGYQIGVTPLQMVTVASVIANGGVLMEPHVVRAFTKDGVRTVVQPKQLRRVISPETAATMTTIMEGVASHGTATRAALTRYRVAGKTGTAEKLVNGKYSSSDVNVSFVGFVPSNEPALAILVIVDRPRKGSLYGGTIAAPIFKRVAEASLQQLAVAPSINPAPPIISATPSELPAPAPVGEPRIVNTSGRPLVPDMTGLSLREANRIANELGMYMAPQGDGMVVSQTPLPGTFAEPGRALTVQLQRHPQPARGGR